MKYWWEDNWPVVAIVVVIVGIGWLVWKSESHWYDEHDRQCAAWLTKAQTPVDSIQIQASCEAIASSHRAEVTAAAALGAAAASNAGRR